MSKKVLHNLWTDEQGTVALLTSTPAYALPADTIDLVEMVIRQTTGSTTTDIAVTRIGMSTYATIPVKDTEGRPVQVWVDRQVAPQVTVWPVPSSNDYTLVYWHMRRIQDAGTSGEMTFDIPERFLPCLISGLALKIASKRPEAEERIPRLKAEYEEAWLAASTEDREKTTMRVVPARMSI